MTPSIRLTTVRTYLAVGGIAFLVVALIHAGILPVGSIHTAWIPESIIAVALLGGFALTYAIVPATRLVAIVAQSFALVLTLIGTYVTLIGLGPTNPWDPPFHFVMLAILFTGLIAAAHRPGTPVMSTARLSIQWLIRGTGILQLVVGLGIWVGVLAVALPFHMASGIFFVILVEGQAVLSGFSGRPRRLALATGIWGLVVIAVGLAQTQILIGDLHWLVRIGHLAIGVAAIALTERLARAAPSA